MQNRKMTEDASVSMAKLVSKIASSSSQSEVLEELSQHMPNSDEVVRAYTNAVKSIASSSSQGNVLKALVTNAKPSAEGFILTLDVVSEVSSSSTQSSVLQKIAKHSPSEVRVWDAYLKAVGSVSSSAGQEVAMKELLERKDLTAGFLIKAMQFVNDDVSSSSSRYELSRIINQRLAEKNLN